MGIRLLLASLLALAVALSVPCCGSETCGAGQTQVCLDDGTTCVCPTPCASFDDCAGSDPSSERYCYGGDLGLCLPPTFFTNKCMGGIDCTGGMCTTTGVCSLLCARSSDCESGCCAWDRTGARRNPTCADTLTGHTCLP